MKFKLEEFRAWENKRVTLVGMSGVGKSYLSAKLRGDDWFHYSGDYRIGTRYLDEHIIDMIKAQAIRIPFLKELLRNDWIYFKNNIRINDLGPVLSFVGKLGDPERGGVEIGEFIERQAIYHQAEVDAMYDIPHFIEKAQKIYGYPHFVNDVGGSLCELDDPGVMDLLVDNTLILYIQVTNKEQEQLLIERRQEGEGLPDLDGTNTTSSRDLAKSIAMVDIGESLSPRARDLFREIMGSSRTNTLIPLGLLQGLGKDAADPDSELLSFGITVYNKTGDIGIAYADAALIQLPNGQRAVAAFMVKGPFNDPRSTDLIRAMAAEVSKTLVGRK